MNYNRVINRLNKVRNDLKDITTFEKVTHEHDRTKAVRDLYSVICFIERLRDGRS